MSVSTGFHPPSASVFALKSFLKDNGLATTGNKAELVQRCSDLLETQDLENEIDARTFIDLTVDEAPSFDDLPVTEWTSDNLPVVGEEVACAYLKSKGGYTKNYRTGLRLCQCGHLSHIQKYVVHSSALIYICARCRPTMKRQPPYYNCFIQLMITAQHSTSHHESENDSVHVNGANCQCPAGEAQSCVHVAALLLTLAEITPKAGTSKPCAWSRPSGQARAQLSSDLDFGYASSEGYQPYTGKLLDMEQLLTSLDSGTTTTGIGLFCSMEKERAVTCKQLTIREKQATGGHLKDPIDHLLNLDKDVLEVEDLISALVMSPEEVKLLAEMTIGQRENPLWMDARQWRITASNFGRICNRKHELYPPSLFKLLLGDYGCPASHAILWGVQHESNAIECLESTRKVHVEQCGIYISHQLPFLGATPDGIIYGKDGCIHIAEVKCPFKHRESSIEEACKDPSFCLEKKDGKILLKRSHNYYYQVIGQLGITGAVSCYFVVWTLNDVFIEEVILDKEFWSCMQHILKSFYCNHLGKKILDRLLLD